MFLILRKMESRSFFISVTVAVCFLKSVVALSSLVADSVFTLVSISFVFSNRWRNT